VMCEAEACSTRIDHQSHRVGGATSPRFAPLLGSAPGHAGCCNTGNRVKSKCLLLGRIRTTDLTK